jgi:hypothetical protein
MRLLPAEVAVLNVQIPALVTTKLLVPGSRVAPFAELIFVLQAAVAVFHLYQTPPLTANNWPPASTTISDAQPLVDFPLSSMRLLVPGVGALYVQIPALVTRKLLLPAIRVELSAEIFLMAQIGLVHSYQTPRLV